MDEILSDSQRIAALTIFRTIYNQSDNDVYSIVSEFVKETIFSLGKHTFSLTEITSLLNKKYGFVLPEAIVQTAIKRLELTKSDGKFFVSNLSDFGTNQIKDEFISSTQDSNRIIDTLLHFVEMKKGDKLDETERSKISHTFFSFLLDHSFSNAYSEYISTYILENKSDPIFINQLNTIKEGIVLYSGIKYNNIDHRGSWKTELTIFVDTEILFHFAGYNGSVYQQHFMDFFAYVNEINTKEKKQLIRLKYFPETKNEIEGFFKKAEFIVQGKAQLNPKVTAMISIVDGCNEVSQILEKKSDFFHLLASNSIFEIDDKNFYDKKLYQYNLVDQNTIDEIQKELGIEDFEKSMKYLNYINILRQGINDTSFDQARFLLLTGNSKTHQIAWNERIKEYGDVPLATSLHFMVNKFWFRLNKGFGGNAFPKTFDVITSAQIVLSKQLNDSIGSQYDQLQTQYKNQEISKEQIIERVASFRLVAKKPEEIDDNDASDVLEIITEKNIEKYIEEKEHLKSKIEEKEEENISLYARLEEQSTKNLLREIAHKKELLKEKKKQIAKLSKQKGSLDSKVDTQYKNYRYKLFFFLFVYCLILTGSTAYFDWNIMEPIMFFMTILLPMLLVHGYVLLLEQHISIPRFLKNKKENYRKIFYSEFHFDLMDLEESVDSEEALKMEILFLEKSLKQKEG